MTRIAISQRVVHNDTGPYDALEETYPAFLAPFGMTLIPIPNFIEDIPGWLRSLGVEGIILSGGNDIHPTRYGGTPDPQTRYAPQRDTTEERLLAYATAERLPVLCICRGLQFMNVHFGGALRAIPHVLPSHETVVDGTTLHTNSYHNFCITAETLAPALRAFAICPDGTIEGAYHPALPIAGIMWHPERAQPDGMTARYNTDLITAFLGRESFWRR